MGVNEVVRAGTTVVNFPRFVPDKSIYSHFKSSHFNIAVASRVPFHLLVTVYRHVPLSKPHNIRLFSSAKFLFIFENEACPPQLASQIDPF